ncbi:hypothetical protein A5658_25340 [Mycobacterium sp. 1245111.1]|uniref:hypothetical protein n=1 Tax=Mycobacterium sp. 1245111.1 TaxID=1834073 RepID=UPI0007FE0444|nr:hypothetical protein [Mycobacterium sp. 1245111.1]OBK38942.1 hypothetical protein A5658_25340 [Mycobacterium sp. 1245111.1]
MRRTWRWQALLAASVVVAGGCSAPGSSAEESPEVVVMTAGAALHDPVWSYRDNSLVGLTGDGRIAEISDVLSGHATTRLSQPLSPGRNLQIGRKNEQHVFVPQPQRNTVAVLDLGTMRKVDEFDAGPAPAYLSEDAGMRVLLALSADGSSVTPVDEYGFQKLPAASVAGDPADILDGSNRGRTIEYHICGPSGVRYFKGHSSPPDERGSMALDVAVSAGDTTATTRSYVARPNDDTLYVIDVRRTGTGMRVRAATRLPSPIRRIGSDESRIYVATDQEVATLETNSFMRFEDDKVPVLRITNYRAALPESQRSAPVSGMALGPHRVFLTFAGTPLVVSVAKAHL